MVRVVRIKINLGDYKIEYTKSSQTVTFMLKLRYFKKLS